MTTEIFRSINSDGDWNFGAGRNSYVRAQNAIKENIRTRVLSWEGDCFFAQNDNVDWINLLGTPGQRQLLEDQIRTTILQTPNVTELVSFDTTLTGRNLTVTYEVNTNLSQSFRDTIERTL